MYNLNLFSRNVDDTVTSMVESKNIVIVPGYGLAVAKGQYPVAELVSFFQNLSKLDQIGLDLSKLIQSWLNWFFCQQGSSTDNL